ncbi:alpha/beta hydrolase family esterase [Burkholderia pseudomallei]|uniref:alpha/beta hydrolase family esterase n=1 Tax=Burkholderia pseudomallei TaxID=28450 RepID=UPI0009B5BAF9|nr:hypothetical protein [Burkholderia pseudomallei]
MKYVSALTYLVISMTLFTALESRADGDTTITSNITTSAPSPDFSPLAPLGPSTTAGTGSTLERISVDGNEISYVFHAFSGLKGKAPTVIVLHGQNGNGEQMERVTGMSQLADTSKFIVAYPDQTNVTSVKALISTLIASHNADPARIYVTGISHGGINTQQVGCQLSSQIAGIASISAGLPVPLEEHCDLVRPFPVILIHGTQDPIVPYNGGVPHTPNAQGHNYRLLSEPNTFDFWRDHNGCTGQAAVTKVSGTDGTVTRTTVSGCVNDAKVALYTVTGGGHTWPGGSTEQQRYASILGPLNTKFDASQAIWNFFSGR